MKNWAKNNVSNSQTFSWNYRLIKKVNFKNKELIIEEIKLVTQKGSGFNLFSAKIAGWSIFERPLKGHIEWFSLKKFKYQ